VRTPAPLAVVAAALPCAATAQQDAWRVQVTPYVWGPSVSGDIRPDPRLPSVHFDLSLGDILEDLDAAFFLDATARRGRFVMMLDLTYADQSLGERWEIPKTSFTPEIDIDVDVDLEITSSAFAVGYAVVHEPDIGLDLMAGARIWSADLTVDVPNRIPRLPERFSESGVWADPIIGARLHYTLVPRWSVLGYADYGGFELAAESTWQAAATVNYRIDERWLVSAGYRALALDYDDGGLDLDIMIAGPLVGVTAQF